MWYLFPSLILLVIFIFRVKRSPGQAYNGILLIIFLFFFWLGTILAFEYYGFFETARYIFLVVSLLGPIMVLIACISLIVNGILVIKKEGLKLSTVLPLLFGLAPFSLVTLNLIFVYICNIYLGKTGFSLDIFTDIFTVFIISCYLTIVYLGFQLLAYTVYAIIYSRLPKLDEIDAVIVLGCGLSKGCEVTPLLKSRLQRALQLRQRQLSNGNKAPLMIVSGGQGADEKRSESEAMAEWLANNGVPEEQIRQENKSKNTKQNLVFSKEILAKEPRVNVSNVVVATSNYHALRSAFLARKLKLSWRIVGAKTAKYYLPTAFLREFIAHLSYARKWHIIVISLLLLPILLIKIGIVFLRYFLN